jgi:serine/threonine protein phosphatase 1
VLPDLHGRLDALEAMLRASGFVGRDLKPRRGAMHLVQLGDILDRGPHPRACVTRLMALEKAAPDRVHILRGNHEEMALRSGDGPEAMQFWMVNGGSATLRDYDGRYAAWLKPGGAHYEWLEKRPRTWEQGGLLFCHAGLGRQRKGSLDPEGLLWDRPPLTRGDYRAVICGHTPTASGRIEVEKGVYRCDIGLGHRPDAALEILCLRLSESGFSSEILPLSL